MVATWASARIARSVNKLRTKIMSIEHKEGNPAPDSMEGKALAELEKEGHTIEGKEAPKDAPKEEVKVEDKPKNEPKDESKDAPKDAPKEEKKPERTPTMVEAWKLEVATKQNEKNAELVKELSAKVEELSKQKAPVTQNQKDEIKAEIAELAKGKEGVDVELLTELADRILSKANKTGSTDVEKTVKELQAANQLSKELNEYSAEFEKDVLPLVADMKLSGEALSKLKESLKNYAFSDIYAKVPLKEIFAIKQSELVQAPKKSSEGKPNIKVRAGYVVDIDNMSEEDFAKLSPEKVDEFVQKKASSGWQRKS